MLHSEFAHFGLMRSVGYVVARYQTDPHQDHYRSRVAYVAYGGAGSLQERRTPACTVINPTFAHVYGTIFP